MASKTMSYDKALEIVDGEGKVAGVLPENFAYKVEAYTVARQPRHPEDWSVTLSPVENPYEWGAWMAYAKAKKVLVVAQYMDKSFRDEVCVDPARCATYKWYFPTHIPSDFDGDHNPAKDKMAGEAFLDWIEKAIDRHESRISAFIEAADPETGEVVTQTSPKKETFPWED